MLRGATLKLQSMLAEHTPFLQSSSCSHGTCTDKLKAFHGARSTLACKTLVTHARGSAFASPRGHRRFPLYHQQLCLDYRNLVRSFSFCKRTLLLQGEGRRCAQGATQETNDGFFPMQKLSSKVLAAQRDGVHGLGLDDPSVPSGSIHLIVGPMFAGKTTALLQRVEEEASKGRKYALVKSDKDTRYGLSSIVSHDGRRMPCWAVPNLASFRSQLGEEDYAKLDLIGIDEAQFLKDLCSFCQAAADYEGKTLIVAGLDGDFDRNKFGSILDLVPLADSIVKLSSCCELCGKPASFTFRKTDDTVKEVIGGNDIYMPVCRQHYFAGKVAIEATRTVLNSGKIVMDTTKPVINSHKFLTLEPDTAEITAHVHLDEDF